MSTEKKSFWKFLKNADYFGVQINFNYRERDKYRSIIGGTLFIGFVVLSLFYVLSSFKSFATRERMNLVFNQQFLMSAPPLNFDEYGIGVAVGLSADYDSTLLPKLYSYFDISFVSVLFNKTSLFKSKTPLNLTKCTKEYFRNNLNESFDLLMLDNYFCPKLNNFTIQGIFTDDIFQYFEFTVSIKRSQVNKTDELLKFMRNYEVKAEVYYIDSAIDVYNITNPVTNYLNSQFLSLDFNYYKKMNVDFMKVSFVSDEDILFQNDQTTTNIMLDKAVSYIVEKGTDRLMTKVADFDKLARLYIRSAPSSQLIKRVYQKITEYLANMSGILSQILLFLFTTVTYINHFKARQSVMKKILKFRENLATKKQESIMYLKEKFNSNNEMQEKLRQSLVKFKSPVNLDKADEPLNHLKKTENITDIIHTTTDNMLTLNKINRDKLSITGNSEFTNINLKVPSLLQNKNKDESSCNNDKSISMMDRSINLNDKTPIIKTGETPLRADETKGKNSAYKSMKNNFSLYKSRNSQFHLDMDDNLKNTNISLNYNICEIFVKLLCPCCTGRKIRIKNRLLQKGEEKVLYQMDILTYIRKMQEIDILKFLLLTQDQNILLNFLSKPSVSVGNKNDIYKTIFQKYNIDLNNKEIDRIYDSYVKIMRREPRSEMDNKLLDIVSYEVEHLII